MKKPKIVSIFSGVGGIDLGFEETGFQTIFATDIWERACQSLKQNLSNSEVVCDDIVNIDFKKIKTNHDEIDGLVGGPPCPAFSKSRFSLAASICLDKLFCISLDLPDTK